jgi:multidrug efflux pump subunit AcrB
VHEAKSAGSKQLGLFYVRGQKGAMIPLDTLISTRSTAGPEFTNRFNLFRTAELTGVPAEGFLQRRRSMRSRKRRARCCRRT